MAYVQLSDIDNQEIRGHAVIITIRKK